MQYSITQSQRQSFNSKKRNPIFSQKYTTNQSHERNNIVQNNINYLIKQQNDRDDNDKILQHDYDFKNQEEYQNQQQIFYEMDNQNNFRRFDKFDRFLQPRNAIEHIQLSKSRQKSKQKQRQKQEQHQSKSKTKVTFNLKQNQLLLPPQSPIIYQPIYTNPQVNFLNNNIIKRNNSQSFHHNNNIKSNILKQDNFNHMHFIWQKQHPNLHQNFNNHIKSLPINNKNQMHDSIKIINKMPQNYSQSPTIHNFNNTPPRNSNNRKNNLNINNNYNNNKHQSKSKLSIKDKKNLQQAVNQNLKSTLLTLKNILIQNEQKVIKLENQLSNIHTSLLRMYNQHQAQLKATVSMRCQKFVNMMKKIIRNLQKKENYVEKIDNKVALFTNTLKSVSEKLRVVSIKQDCIQVLAGRDHNFNQNKYKENGFKKHEITNESKSKQKDNFKPKSNQKKIKQKDKVQIQNSDVYYFYNFDQFNENNYFQDKKQQLSSFWRNSDHIININEQSNKNETKQKNKEQQKIKLRQYLSNHNRNKSSNYPHFQIQKTNFNHQYNHTQDFDQKNFNRLSPFQANQMIKNSYSLPMRINNLDCTKNHLNFSSKKNQDIDRLEYFKLKQGFYQSPDKNILLKENLNNEQTNIKIQDFQTFNNQNSFNQYLNKNKQLTKSKSKSKQKYKSNSKTNNNTRSKQKYKKGDYINNHYNTQNYYWPENSMNSGKYNMISSSYQNYQNNANNPAYSFDQSNNNQYINNFHNTWHQTTKQYQSYERQNHYQSPYKQNYNSFEQNRQDRSEKRIVFKKRIQQLSKLLVSSKGSIQPIKCYLDELGCLRRANNTYFFEQNGNVLMMKPQQLNELIKLGLIQQILMNSNNKKN